MSGPFFSVTKKNTSFPLLFRPGLLSQAAVHTANFLGMSYYMKHSIFLRNYKEYTERHGNYGREEPCDELNDILNNVISKDLKDVASENIPVGLYLTSGVKTNHLGTVGTWAAALVGIPVFYEFKNAEDVRDNILVKSVGDNNAIVDKEELSDYFLLSDKAKKYGIAREILLVNTFKVWIIAVIPFAISFITLMLYKELVKTYDVLKRPLFVRCLIYSVFIIVGLNIWRMAYKRVLQHYEAEIEEKIAELGLDYIEGGIEYCTKEMKRNSLSVEIKGEKLRYFKLIDDFFCKILPTGVPIDVRLLYLKSQLEKSKTLNE